ncbi:hypothetical protein EDC04DRAFT_1328295 [Pisolithus marmoratus]|nr:hypothetical protein EDC04DRAFT_1328295 [Pisolithus marmoratus]
MHVDHLHCHPVAFGFIGSDWCIISFWIPQLFINDTCCRMCVLSCNFPLMLSSLWLFSRMLLVCFSTFSPKLSFIVSILYCSGCKLHSSFLSHPNFLDLRMCSLTFSNTCPCSKCLSCLILCHIQCNILLNRALVKDERNDVQVALDLAIAEYQTSGITESVCKLINEAFQQHGNNIQILPPILLQVAQEKQM